MKERIYTIPLTDALSEGCGCVLCTLEKKLEEEAVTYFLGPSLMEPDGRMETNKKGFCRRHMAMLLEGGNRLGMALTLETHLAEIMARIVPKKKSGVLARGTDVSASAEDLEAMIRSCALCDKLGAQMSAAAQNMVYLLESEKDFREGFCKSEGLCLDHFALLIRESAKELSGKKLEDFISFIYKLQQEKLDALCKRVHSFTLSFDYRSKGKPDAEIASSVEAAAKKLTKY